jgi:plastocyanin
VSTTETGQASDAPEVAPVPSPGRGVRPIWFVVAFLGCLAAGGLLVTVAVGGAGSDEPKVWAYTVPTGTGARIEAGEQLYVFPARLDVKVGDQMVIRNEDVRPAEVGPYLVDRNSTLTQTFTSPGIIQGFCSIHPSGKVTIEVHA